jgi:hypothetical protein
MEKSLGVGSLPVCQLAGCMIEFLLHVLDIAVNKGQIETNILQILMK